ncbi:hypothetical protein MRX96_030393 [Rhipicephalus microplus]
MQVTERMIALRRAKGRTQSASPTSRASLRREPAPPCEKRGGTRKETTCRMATMAFRPLKTSTSAAQPS